MATSKRLLISGDVNGNFAALFKRVTALHGSKNGPFDMLLVSGTFFGAPDDDASAVLAQLAAAPIPTYFTDARGKPQSLPLPTDGGVVEVGLVCARAPACVCARVRTCACVRELLEAE